MTRRSHGLANRPGQPYPATFRKCMSLQWTAGESNPDYLGANQASSRWTSGPGAPEVYPDFELLAVTGAGVEPADTRPSTSPLCRFAYPVGSCRPRYRTGRTSLMTAGWAPARLQIIGSQGEIRTPKPSRARRFERRASAGCATWPCCQCAGQELNLHSLSGWLLYRQLGSPVPSRRMGFRWRRRESNPQTRRFELRRFAGLRTAPCLVDSALGGI